MSYIGKLFNKGILRDFRDKLRVFIKYQNKYLVFKTPLRLRYIKLNKSSTETKRRSNQLVQRVAIYSDEVKTGKDTSS